MQLVSAQLGQRMQNQQEVCPISDQTRTYTTPKMTMEERRINGHFLTQALIINSIHLFSLYILYDIMCFILYIGTFTLW